MVYSRRTSRRRGTSRRRQTSWYNKKYSTLQLAQKAWSATKYLKGLVNSEKFNADRSFTLGAVQSDIYGLVRIAQGDGESERTGNSILCRSIYLRGFMQVNSAVSGNTRVCLCLVQDTQQIADTNPTVLDIFNSLNPEAMINRSNTNNTAGRFKIIWRKNYNLTPATGSTPSINIDKYFKVYSHVKYNGSGSQDLQKNGYYLVMLTSEATNFPTISLTSRVNYHDN